MSETFETISAEERAQLRRLHRLSNQIVPIWRAHCSSCLHDWPCETTRLLADVERLERALAEVTAERDVALTRAWRWEGLARARGYDERDDDG